MQPLYVTRPAYQRTGDIVIVLITIGILIAGIGLWFAFPDQAGVIWINVFVMLSIPAIIWVVFPRRFEVYADRLRIVFKVLPDWEICFGSIAEARAARWWESYAAFGVRMTTHPGKAVFIQRIRPGLFRNLNAVISPEDRDEFLAALHSAYALHRT